MRITVHDTEKTVSFLGEVELAPYLVAACTMGPAHFEALILDVDSYQPGIAARVSGALLAFDAGPVPDGPHSLGEAPAPPGTFEVRDARAARRAAEPDGEGVLTIDLVARRIGGWIQADPPAASGMITARASTARSAPSFMHWTPDGASTSLHWIMQGRRDMRNLGADPAFVARYEIAEPLAQHPSEQAYRSVDRQSGDTVTVTLFDELGQEAAFVAHFRRRARIARDLDHSHLLRTLAYGHAERHYYLVTEYIDGPSLTEALLHPARRGVAVQWHLCRASGSASSCPGAWASHAGSYPVAHRYRGCRLARRATVGSTTRPLRSGSGLSQSGADRWPDPDCRLGHLRTRRAALPCLQRRTTLPGRRHRDSGASAAA